MTIEICLLGRVHARIDGRAVEFASARQRTLLSLLALQAEHPVPPERLVEQIWSGSPPPTARKYVHVLVGRLRSRLRELADADTCPIATRDGGYVLCRQACRVDAAVFEELVLTARSHAAAGRWAPAASTLRRALDTWSGRPFGDLAYEEWAQPHLARLEALHAEACELWAETELASGRHDASLPQLHALVAEHPSSERLLHSRALALYRAGRQADALAACRNAIAAGAGSTLRALERAILQQSLALLHVARAASSRLPGPPAPPNATIGRERELAALARLLLDPHRRMVTITGTGGCGKTRVAVEVARTLQERTDGAVFVELAPIATAEEVLPGLASALGITAAEADPLDAIAQAVGVRELLVVLDNFEHVLAAAGGVAAILDRCPNLTLLVTSRAPLGVAEENRFELAPLHVPAGADLDDHELLCRSAAVRLFGERARAVRTSFRVDSENAATVAQLCARLDGLPLAIELAAARARLLSPEEILERLDRRLTLLTAAPSDVPERQRSLRSVVAWSYELLDDDARLLLRALGVFSGGCTVDALAVVAGMEPSDPALQAGVESLVAHSLVQRDVDAAGDVRLSLLETIIQFAAELVEQDPNLPLLRQRHAEHFHAVARAKAGQSGRSVDARRNLLRNDHANIRSAMAWAVAHQPAIAADLVACLGDELLVVLSRREAFELVEAALSVGGETEDGIGALLTAAGDLAERCGHPDAALRHRQAALAHYVAAGDRRGQAAALNGLGDGAITSQLFDEALPYLHRALEFATAISDRAMAAQVHNNLGRFGIDTDQLGMARAHYSEALRLFSLEGDAYWRAQVLMNLGCVASQAGEANEALTLLDEALAVFRACDYGPMIAHALCNRISFMFELERFDEAVAVSDEAIARARETGDLLILSFGLVERAVSLLEIGRVERARDAAAESLSLAVRSRHLRFAHYAAYVLARDLMSRREWGAALEAWLAVDPSLLVDDCLLDRLVSRRRAEAIVELHSSLGKVALEEIAGSLEHLPYDERLRRLLERAGDGTLSGLALDAASTT